MQQRGHPRGLSSLPTRALRASARHQWTTRSASQPRNLGEHPQRRRHRILLAMQRPPAASERPAESWRIVALGHDARGDGVGQRVARLSQRPDNEPGRGARMGWGEGLAKN